MDCHQQYHMRHHISMTKIIGHGPRETLKYHGISRMFSATLAGMWQHFWDWWTLHFAVRHVTTKSHLRLRFMKSLLACIRYDSSYQGQSCIPIKLGSYIPVLPISKVNWSLTPWALKLNRQSLEDSRLLQK